MRTSSKLKRDFLRKNKKWFAGRLPKNTKTRWNPNLKWQGVLGQAWGPEGGPYFIDIARELKKYPVIAEWVMLHEMIHILMYVRGINDVGHGPRFQKQMLKLAKAGALNKIW